MQLRIHADPWKVISTDEGYDGEFWISSRAFLFPWQGWRDDVPLCLTQMCQALTALEEQSTKSEVRFRGASHLLVIEADATKGLLRLIYRESGALGMVYQEKVDALALQRQVRTLATDMLGVCVKRRWREPAAHLSDALSALGD